MRKKIVRQGQQSLTITLPIDWARANNLDKGSYVEMAERGSCLALYSAQDCLKEAEIKAEGNLENLKSQLIGLYLYGVEKITIDLNQKLSPEIPVSKFIKKVVSKYLHGMAVDERYADKCVINSYSTSKPLSFDKAIKNCLTLILDSSHKVISTLRTNNEQLVLELVDNHDDVKRFGFYTLRLLSKGGNIEFKKLIYLSRAVDKIIDLSNMLRHLAKYYHKGKRSKKVITALHQLKDLLQAMHNSYYDINQANHFFNLSEQLRNYLNKSNIEKEIKENIFMIRELAINLVRQALIVKVERKGG